MRQPATSNQQPAANNDDLLWRQLKTIPAFRALLRAVEARFYQQIEMPGPILDLGCGDGHFAQMTFDQPLDAGADPWWGPLQKAHKSGMYGSLAQSMGDKLPFPDAHFGTVISNSVLEHIPGIQPVLNEANRVTQMDGQLVITMPSHLFTDYLGGAGFFEGLGTKGLAAGYRRLFNRISRHAHTDPPEMWGARLAEAGFAIERWQYYFSKEALRALEWGHAQGMPSAILHAITGHWIIGPWENNLRRTERWVRPFYEEPFGDEGAYILFVARKVSNSPIETNLPPARPFSPEELATRDGKLETEVEIVSVAVETIDDQQPTPSPQPPAPSRPAPKLNPRVFSGSLLFLSLFFALIGQSILNTHPLEPDAGLRWYGYSLIPLLLLVWRQRRFNWPGLPQWQRPQLGRIPRQRWYYLLALFFAMLAPRLANANAANPLPGLAIFLWLAAGSVALYALQAPHASRIKIHASRFTLIASGALFLTALIVRAVNLTGHPFILDGAEASIGLDVLHVADGSFENPFATGWLTNPSLLYFLLALPMKLLGPSILSIRLLSPLVGALTVVAAFLIGKRLWGQEVGLVTAVLLLGSHFHLHYSRMGMTNIWDPLLMLLALGLLGIAWQEGTEEHGRFRWLLAGTAVGLNAYVFTGSHLLPLMLAALGVLGLLFGRETIKQQWRHILAAAALTLVIAWPQISYYRQNPTIFMDRANALGILDGQTGWLTQEAARTGVTPSNLLRDQIVQGLLSYNYGLDRSGSYRPERPLLNLGVSVLCVVGLAFSALRLRQFSAQLLLVWVIVPVIFGSALLLESPSSHRLIIAAPALALLAAIGLVELGRLAGGQRSRGAEGSVISPAPPLTRASALLPILLGLAMVLALLDISFYFGTYRQQHSFADRNTEIASEMSAYLNTLEGDWTAYFYGPPSMYVSFPTIPFLASEFVAGTNLHDVNEAGELLPPSDTNQTFIFLPERSGELEVAQAVYPNGRLQTFTGHHANPLFYAYEVGK